MCTLLVHYTVSKDGGLCLRCGHIWWLREECIPGGVTGLRAILSAQENREGGMKFVEIGLDFSEY